MKVRVISSLLCVAALSLVVAIRAQETPKAKTGDNPATQVRDDAALEEQKLQRHFRDFQEQVLKLKLRLERSPRIEDRDRAVILQKVLDKAQDMSISIQFEKVVSDLKKDNFNNVGEIKQAALQAQKLADDLRELVALIRDDGRAKRSADESKKLEQLIKEIEAAIRQQKTVQDLTELGKTDKKELKGNQQQVTEAIANIKKNLDGKNDQGGEGKNQKGQNKDGGKAGEGKKGESKDQGKEGKKGETKDQGKAGDSKDKEGKTGEAKGDPKSGDPKSGDPKSGEAKSGEAKSGQKGSESKEAGAKGSKGEGKPGEAKESKGGKEGAPKEGKEGAAKDQGEKKGGVKEKTAEAKGAEGDKKNNDKKDPSEGKQGEAKAGPKGEQGGAKENKSGSESKPGEAKKGSESKQGEAKSGSKSQGQGEAKDGGQQPPPQAQQPNQKGDPNQKQPSPQEDVKTGKKQIQEAEGSSQKAEEKIGKENPKDAGPDQNKVITELEKAKKKLEDLLRQLREEEKERVLADLLKRCEKMLAMQIEVLNGTEGVFASVQKNSDKKPAQENRVASAKLADKEKDIVGEASRAIEVLEAEGTAVAFPEVFQQVREDMKHVHRRLDVTDVGPVTQAIERDIIDSLKEMIEALKKAQKDQQAKKSDPKDGPPPKSGPQDQKLLEQIAELKMIRSMQIRVNNRTETYGKMYPGEQAAEAQIRREVIGLAERQERIFEITNKIAKGDNK